MGINAINCEGYAETGKTEAGVAKSSSSDFNGADVVKGALALAAIVAASGCVDMNAPPTKDTVRYDKDSEVTALGVITDEADNIEALNGLPGYVIQVERPSLNIGEPLVIHPIDKNNHVLNEYFTACRVALRNGIFSERDYHYVLTCGSIKDDGIGIGDAVAVYRAVEVK